MLYRRRPRRFATACFVVLSLLFSQLALASYACPILTGVDTMAEKMAAGEPCDGMDRAQPVLCHQHCAGAAQSFEAIKLPCAPLPAIVQVRVLPIVPDGSEYVAAPMAATPEARPPPDPLFLSTLRLRV